MFIVDEWGRRRLVKDEAAFLAPIFSLSLRKHKYFTSPLKSSEEFLSPK
jgi:hypothetical protein